MKIIHFSYAQIKDCRDPETCLKRLRFLVVILESLSKYVESAGIFHITYKGKLEKNNVTYYFPDLNKWQLLVPIHFNRFVKSLQPNVIIVHGLIFPWQVIMLRWQLGKDVKIIVQHHAEKPLRDVRHYIQRWADSYIDAYLFCSLDQGKRWNDVGQIRNFGKIKEVMGSSSPFYPIEKKEAMSITGVSGDKIYVWVGGLDHNKNPLLTARAFLRLAKCNPSVRLYMIFQTFELLDELKSLIENSHRALEFIKLIGTVKNEQLQNWYSSADFVISSSYYEGSGIAVCEAMSCGCIPILTNIPSFRMMTDNGRVGLLYEPGNEDALLSALNESLLLNENIKFEVLRQFKEKLSPEANAKSIVAIAETII
jgi:glycosyltransferase involved in cell wall biosynthesis